MEGNLAVPYILKNKNITIDFLDKNEKYWLHTTIHNYRIIGILMPCVM